MLIHKILQISRPRFWMYTFGPYMIGYAAVRGPQILAYGSDDFLAFWSHPLYIALVVIASIYALVIINILIYGVNDLADEDTDAFNTKKSDYEHRLARTERHNVQKWIRYTQIAIGLPLIALLVSMEYMSGNGWWRPIVMMGVRLFVCVFYSLPPIRAKAYPFVDGIFNILYIIPALLGWMVALAPLDAFSRLGFVAGWMWAIAMHAYSAIPDIQPDTEAGLATTAIYLGKHGTLIYCAVLWILAGILGSQVAGYWVLLLLIPYLVMIALSRSREVMSLYRRFPWINTGVGFFLFWSIMIP